MSDEKILIVDDEQNIVELIKFNLESSGYNVLCAYNGQDAVDIAKKEQPSLILLDLMLPVKDGLEVCKEIRRDILISNTPIIMLTAKCEELDKILGLELGADDYITKPFSLAVLRARVNTQLRKDREKESTKFVDGSFVFDFERMEFRSKDVSVELSKTEQKLLRILTEHAGITVSRENLVDRIWTDGAEYVDENALSVTVNRLRSKLGAQKAIKTVYGIGYMWVSGTA